MLVTGFAAGPWATNCWVVSQGPSSECVIIDPGFDSLARIADIVAENHLKPVAAFLTHGHVDHMWSVYPLSKGYDIPAVIHSADRHLLADPGQGISAEGRNMITMLGGEFAEPDQVLDFAQDTQLNFAGFDFRIQHAPGHTPGSVVFSLVNDELPRMFSGDVLFQGSIGRTDLPGGDHSAMLKSLERVILSADPETHVHCGHGSDTTIAQELRTNPYLRGLS